jgi:hypothetical protein
MAHHFHHLMMPLEYFLFHLYQPLLPLQSHLRLSHHYFLMIPTLRYLIHHRRRLKTLWLKRQNLILRLRLQL